MLRLKLQYFGHLMPRANSVEKTLMLGKTEGMRRRAQRRIRRLYSITDSMDMNLSRLWEIAEDRGAWCTVRNDLATEQQITQIHSEVNAILPTLRNHNHI